MRRRRESIVKMHSVEKMKKPFQTILKNFCEIDLFNMHTAQFVLIFTKYSSSESKITVFPHCEMQNVNK